MTTNTYAPPSGQPIRRVRAPRGTLLIRLSVAQKRAGRLRSIFVHLKKGSVPRWWCCHSSSLVDYPGQSVDGIWEVRPFDNFHSDH